MPVYLIHFTTPYKHAKHYLGYAADVSRRIKRHRAGCGARLLSVLNQEGIEWKVVRVWPSGDRALERSLKRLKGACRICPVCNPKMARFLTRRKIV